MQSEEKNLETCLKNDDTPLVSICVVSYNHEDFIEDTLKSFLMQETSFSFEIVVDDDCSTDMTQSIIQQYTEKYPSIIKANLRDENVGVATNEIGSLKRARGEYIAICEGDDAWIDSGKLQYQIEKMREYPSCDISFHPVRLDYDETLPLDFLRNYIEKSHNILSKNGDYYLFSNYGKEDILFASDDIIRKGGGFIATSSIILKRSIIEDYADLIENEVKKVEGKFLDYYLQILGSVRGGALFLPRAMSTYTLHNSGVWTSMLIKEDTSSLNAAESGMISVLSAIDDVLDHKYHDVLQSTIEAILTKIIGRAQTPIDERIKIVDLYSQYLSVQKQLQLKNLLIDKLLKQTNDPVKVSLSSEEIDALRDVASSLENLNVNYAYVLMNIAHRARPAGDYIIEKLKEYKKLLSI